MTHIFNNEMEYGCVYDCSRKDISMSYAKCSINLDAIAIWNICLQLMANSFIFKIEIQQQGTQTIFTSCIYLLCLASSSSTLDPIVDFLKKV